MKIASWNVNSLKVRLPHLLDWLAQVQPDIMALQETKLTDDKFPFDELAAAGYHAVCSGQKTYQYRGQVHLDGAPAFHRDANQPQKPKRPSSPVGRPAIRVRDNLEKEIGSMPPVQERAQRLAQRSGGCKPVRLAMRDNIRGPISSLSWKANTKSGQPSRARVR